MTRKQAIESQVAISYETSQEAQTIKSILFNMGLIEDEQWMPDSRYSYVNIKSDSMYELDTTPFARQIITYSDFISNNNTKK